MSDPCENYMDCGDGSADFVVASDGATFTHEIDHSIEGYLTTRRTFKANFGWARSKSIDYYVASNGSLDVAECGKRQASNPSSSVSEDCSITKTIPFYYDLMNGVKLERVTKETLNFSKSGSSVAAFKTLMGTSYFHKLTIKDTSKVVGNEKFVLTKNGVQTIIAEANYTYNSFPIPSPQGTWGLQGDVISNTFGTPEANVGMILCFPNPPSLGIPQDADIAKYGFYDYNEDPYGTSAGNKLGQADGGKDMFYPEWCRNMVYDPLWAEVAARRWAIRWDKSNPETSAAWNPPEPETYNLPFGSFAFDTLENFIASCLLQFNSRTNGRGVIYNHTSFGDLYKAMYPDNKLNGRPFNLYNPVSPI